jgi:hypothetical protein
MRYHNQPEVEESRGNKPLIRHKEIQEINYILRSNGFDARALTWLQLRSKVSIKDIDRDTTRKAIRQVEYYKCIDCSRG